MPPAVEWDRVDWQAEAAAAIIRPGPRPALDAARAVLEGAPSAVRRTYIRCRHRAARMLGTAVAPLHRLIIRLLLARAARR